MIFIVFLAAPTAADWDLHMTRKRPLNADFHDRNKPKQF